MIHMIREVRRPKCKIDIYNSGDTRLNVMEKSFWDRVQKLKESINGGVEPKDDVHLRTRLVKIALGMYLLQSFTIALWWSIKDAAFYPWLIPISAFLQVGWFWNKVTSSWKAERVYVNHSIISQQTMGSEFIEPHFVPTINIHNEPITRTKSIIINDPRQPFLSPEDSAIEDRHLWGVGR